MESCKQKIKEFVSAMKADIEGDEEKRAIPEYAAYTLMDQIAKVFSGQTQQDVAQMAIEEIELPQGTAGILRKHFDLFY